MYNQYYGTASLNRAMEIGQAFQDLVTGTRTRAGGIRPGMRKYFPDERKRPRRKVRRWAAGVRYFCRCAADRKPRTRNVRYVRGFVRTGGRLIAFGHPSRVEGEPSAEAGNFFLRRTARISLAECTPEAIDRYLRSEGIRFVRREGGDLHHHRREFDGGQTLLLVNASLDEASDVEVALNGKHAVRMDALDGKVYENAGRNGKWRCDRKNPCRTGRQRAAVCF